MQVILFLIPTIYVLFIVFPVIVTYTIRRYELGNRSGEAVEYGRVSSLDAILGILGEIAALTLSAILYPFGCFGNRNSLSKLRNMERTVILCHGYMHNRSAFFPIAYRLRKAGWNNIVMMNFRPASASVNDYARTLSQTVERVKSLVGCRKVDVVGHSMGGLVIRYFIESLGGSTSVQTAITLGTPHLGTKMAALSLFRSGSQFQPDSSLITGMKETCGEWDSVNMIAVWSGFDNVVLPPENAKLPEPCENVMVRNLGHIALLYSSRVFDRISCGLAGETME